MIARCSAPEPLSFGPLRDFVLAALRTDPLVDRPERAVEELRARIADPTCGVYFGSDGKEMKALMILDANHSEFSRAVVVVHIYNRGGTGMLRDLFRAMEVFKIQHQLTRVHGIDINQRPRAYCRLFRLRNWTPKAVGTFYQFSER